LQPPAGEILEQNCRIEHRFIKRRVKLGPGFFSFETTVRTLQGYEIMNMVKKGQIYGVEKGDSRGQVMCIGSLFGVSV
jgi:transposase, IS6 family